MKYRSITVITGHVNAPAVAALAISTPSLVANRSVFHLFEGAGDNGRSETVVAVADMGREDEVSFVIAFLVILFFTLSCSKRRVSRVPDSPELASVRAVRGCGEVR